MPNLRCLQFYSGSWSCIDQVGSLQLQSAIGQKQELQRSGSAGAENQRSGSSHAWVLDVCSGRGISCIESSAIRRQTEHKICHVLSFQTERRNLAKHSQFTNTEKKFVQTMKWNSPFVRTRQKVSLFVSKTGASRFKQRRNFLSINKYSLFSQFFIINLYADKKRMKSINKWSSKKDMFSEIKKGLLLRLQFAVLDRPIWTSTNLD